MKRILASAVTLLILVAVGCGSEIDPRRFNGDPCERVKYHSARYTAKWRALSPNSSNGARADVEALSRALNTEWQRDVELCWESQPRSKQ